MPLQHNRTASRNSPPYSRPISGIPSVAIFFITASGLISTYGVVHRQEEEDGLFLHNGLAGGAFDNNFTPLNYGIGAKSVFLRSLTTDPNQLDLVYYDSSGVQVCPGAAAGGNPFLNCLPFSVMPGIIGLDFGDFDLDGHLDFAVLSVSDVAVFHNTGTGTFTTELLSVSMPQARSLVVMEVDCRVEVEADAWTTPIQANKYGAACIQPYDNDTRAFYDFPADVLFSEDSALKSVKSQSNGYLSSH